MKHKQQKTLRSGKPRIEPRDVLNALADPDELREISELIANIDAFAQALREGADRLLKSGDTPPRLANQRCRIAAQLHTMARAALAFREGFTVIATELSRKTSDEKEECCHGTKGCHDTGDKHWCASTGEIK